MINYNYTDQREGQTVPIGAVVGVIAGLAITAAVTVVSAVLIFRCVPTN